jgi:hypothetical protein
MVDSPLCCVSCLDDALRLCPLFAPMALVSGGENGVADPAGVGVEGKEGDGEVNEILGDEERRGIDGVRVRDIDRRRWS